MRSKIRAARGLGDRITGKDHFEAGVEIIDVIERKRFRRFRINRRPELWLAMMRSDQVQQMETTVLHWRSELLPFGHALVGLDFSPKRIDQIHPERDVANDFALFVKRHAETGFGQIIFPKLAGIVEKNPGHQEIKV